MTDTAYISGWFESEEGAVLFNYEDIEDYETLAQLLYLEFGDDCAGVDLEVNGVYLDGTDVSTQMVSLLDDLDYLCN
jgi:hypothetical protein|tara:strand:+ start:1391 stop:1621 length:231 start_codon:yes stop_codon:yes gene_type:complete